jgi:integrase
MMAQVSTNTADDRLLSVTEAAGFLNVSECWVRRHKSELPMVRVGRLIRFDARLISEKLKSTMPRGNSLKSERATMLNRYQRGYVFQRGKRGNRVWYGKFRLDVRTPEGIQRRQRLVRLGPVAELPTKNAARDELAELMSIQEKDPLVMDIDFAQLRKRWEDAEGPTMKTSTRERYVRTLKGYLVPAFGNQKISRISREDIQRYLAENAKDYSTSILRSMRVALSLTLGWAAANRWLPSNPCSKIKLPKVTGGRRVVRTALSDDQVRAIIGRLKEPYATLVLLLATTGLRISEAIGLQRADIDGNTVRVLRRVYHGDVDAPKSAKSRRVLPLHPAVIERLRALKPGPKEWLFQSRSGTPLNPGNVLKRYIHPAARDCGFKISGWHDFRHTATTNMRKKGVQPKVVSDILGHERVNLAMDVYDRTDNADLAAPLAAIAAGLVSNGINPVGTA